MLLANGLESDYGAPMKNVSVRLTDAEAQLIAEHADREDRSMSKVLKRALLGTLLPARRLRTPEPEQRLEDGEQ